MKSNSADMVFEGLLRIADDNLILGHRTSEWCGHAPTLEEDLALPNIARLNWTCANLVLLGV